MKEKADRVAGLEEEGKMLERMVSRLTVIGERVAVGRGNGKSKSPDSRDVLRNGYGSIGPVHGEGFTPDNMQRLTDEMNRVALLNKEKLDGETVRGNTEKEHRAETSERKYVARLDEISREIVQRDLQVGLLQGNRPGLMKRSTRGYPTWRSAGAGRWRQRFRAGLRADYQRDAACG